MELKRLSPRHKNNKFAYYIHNYLRLCVPNKIDQDKLKKLLQHNLDINYVDNRVEYYNKIFQNSIIYPNAKPIKDLKLKDGSKTYVFDSKEYTRYFDCKLKVGFEYGDVTCIPEFPGFVKSRPINDNNSNSILCIILIYNGSWL